MVFGTPKFLFGTGVLMFALFFVVKSDESCDIEIENTLKTLLKPQEYPSMQNLALRKDLLRRLQQALDRVVEDDDMNYKRSISSLAQWGNLPGKRNLEALARAGYIRTLPNPDEEDPNNKRSLSTLAKNDQLPTFQNNESKRGIESLARNGELHNRRDIQELLDELYDKRNIGSLARNFNFPSYGKRYLGSLVRNGESQYSGKRNIASIARDGGFVGKRNVAALLRQDDYLNEQNNDEKDDPQVNSEKRNIASIKAQYPGQFTRAVRSKRQTTYYEGENGEFSLPVYQNQNVDDYEELMKALAMAYPNNDKRFLGSVARSGWFRPNSRYRSPEKRHIGALARLGWLPTLRNVRRFNRSGRSTSLEGCRETTPDGEAEDDSVAENSFSLDDKRFLLQPAVDQILLRKIFMHPRTHSAINSDLS
ncbi:neuropeptide-like 1 [Tribolium madens]|uniref:neuropeptide-like 1 n=1 Tax=Tribolium madens TaxID=41895 RepID=UPI001CF721E0|nr:neuropeptide-like 1 [Tribolium madens]